MSVVQIKRNLRKNIKEIFDLFKEKDNKYINSSQNDTIIKFHEKNQIGGRKWQKYE